MQEEVENRTLTLVVSGTKFTEDFDAGSQRNKVHRAVAESRHH